jgi:hypothetical protein
MGLGKTRMSFSGKKLTISNWDYWDILGNGETWVISLISFLLSKEKEIKKDG